jgi:CheY-like chemotaxis protein
MSVHAAPATADELRDVSILVVDDDLGTRETFECGLRASGLRVRTAGGGAEGIVIARTAAFDLLLVDLEMPDMRGTDMVRALQRETRASRFVLMSAFLTTHVTVDAMRLGALDVVEKPICVDDLPALICAALRPSSGTSGAEAPSQTGRQTAPIPRLAEVSKTSNLGCSAERWAAHVIEGCYSRNDLKTLELWASCAGVSYTSLRDSCRSLGIRPLDARDLMRVLRAVILSSRHGCSPEVLLDVSDKRTLDGLLERGGLTSVLKGSASPSIDDVFERQRFVRNDNIAVRLLRTMMAATWRRS